MNAPLALASRTAFVLALTLCTSVAAHAQSDDRSMSLRQLLSHALQHGHAQGPVKGELANTFKAPFGQALHPTQAVQLSITRLTRFSGDCGQFQLDFAAAPGPLAAKPASGASQPALSINMNLCTDGSPALQGLRSPS